MLILLALAIHLSQSTTTSTSRILQGDDSQIPPAVSTVLQPSTPLDFSFEQRIANVCIHFLIWTGSPTSPTCGFHMAFMNARSLFQLVLMLQCFNCHNTVVSRDKSTRYAEKIMGKNPVLFTWPNSSTRRICLGSCREKRYVGVWRRKISQSDDPITPKLPDCFHLQSMTIFSRAARSLNLAIPPFGVFVASHLQPSLLSLSMTLFA